MAFTLADSVSLYQQTVDLYSGAMIDLGVIPAKYQEALQLIADMTDESLKDMFDSFYAAYVEGVNSVTPDSSVESIKELNIFVLSLSGEENIQDYVDNNGITITAEFASLSTKGGYKLSFP